MSIITGDETGLIKLVSIADDSIVSSFGQQSRSLGIKGLCWLDSQEDFLSVRENGVIETWKADGVSLISTSAQQSAIDNVVSCRRIWSDSMSLSSPTSIICCDAEGNVSIEKIGDVTAKPRRYQVTGPLTACCTCLNGGAIFGGRENDAQLYDVNTQQSVWRAKNVPHDKLSLRVPVWITALSLLNNSSSTSGANFVSGTGYKHIRVYDTKANRQPVVSFEIGDEYRVTSINVNKEGESVYVGDTSGGMHLWDLRMQRRVYTLKGSTGSIRDIQMDTDGSKVAAVGLDRYLRVYNTKTNKSEKNIYLKNRLNVCLVGDHGSNHREGSGDSGVMKGKKAKKVVDNDGDDDLLEQYKDSDDEEVEDSASGESDSEEEEGSEVDDEGSDSEDVEQPEEDESDEDEEEDDEDESELEAESEESEVEVKPTASGKRSFSTKTNNPVNKNNSNSNSKNSNSSSNAKKQRK